MTRSELRVLSEAHAVALAAMTAPETRIAPMAAAFALQEAAAVDLPGFAPDCTRFVEALRQSCGRLDEVARAGRVLRDAVARGMAFRPCDAARVDIHG
jgi:DNA-binding FadR family transcriptional regulator